MSRGADNSFQHSVRLVVLTVVILVASATQAAEGIRPLCFSSIKYPASSVPLYNQVETFTKAISPVNTCGETAMIIVPNQAYLYVGPLLGAAYSAVSAGKFDRIVLLGFDEAANPVTVYSGLRLSTPMGQNPVDNEFCARFTEMKSVNILTAAPEACLPSAIEIQLPFVQYYFSNVPVVPIGIGGFSPEDARILGLELAELTGGSSVLFIAATNLTSSFDIESCESRDNSLLQLLRVCDIEKIIAGFENGIIEAESPGALIVALTAAGKRGANACDILRYENTGRITGDHQFVCGYLSAVISEKSDSRPVRSNISTEEGAKFLGLARAAIEQKAGLRTDLPPRIEFPNNVESDGVHIALLLDGYRGGVGSVFPNEPLYDVVKNVAVTSAFCDPRYNPIMADEIAELRIRLYFLCNFIRLDSPESFEPGRHGVWVRKGSYSAKVFPDEMDISLPKPDILGRICLEAGLLSGCWQQTDTEVWIFDLQVFEEKR